MRGARLWPCTAPGQLSCSSEASRENFSYPCPIFRASMPHGYLITAILTASDFPSIYAIDARTFESACSRASVFDRTRPPPMKSEPLLAFEIAFRLYSAKHMPGILVFRGGLWLPEPAAETATASSGVVALSLPHRCLQILRAF